MIFKVDKKCHGELIEVWEKSVRATHDFLSEKNIEDIKKKFLCILMQWKCTVLKTVKEG